MGELLVDLSFFPKDLRAKAVILSGEAAWPREAAREVIDFLANNDYAPVGVELWEREGGSPRVLGWSNYKIDYSGDWPEYVESNAREAKRVLESATANNQLFNVTWLSLNDLVP